LETIEEEKTADDNDVCTFVKTGAQHQTQHFYYCYTCNLVNSKGCCTTCAKKCHQGHDVVYARSTRCYCDCGDGTGPNPCKCLKKEAIKPKKSREKEKRDANDNESRPKNPFNAGLFFSAFGNNSNQIEEILR